jgi:RNA polymerase sigma-70 factor (ECF subfamily)
MTAEGAARETTPPAPLAAALRDVGEGPDVAGAHPALVRERLARTIEGRLDGLHRFVFHRVAGDARAAEDIVQETVCIAWAKDGAPADEEEQEKWLRGIARNLVRRHWRLHPGAARRVAKMERMGREIARRLTQGLDGGAAGVQAEEVERLMLALSGLSHADQELMLMRYRAGKSQAAMAQEMGVTEKAVECALHRARGRLRGALTMGEDVS